jgi:hypothetical protein
MSAFVITVAIPLLPIFGAVTIGEAAINARKKGSSFKEELKKILDENDSDLIEQLHSETKIIFQQEIHNFIKELNEANITLTEIEYFSKKLEEILNEWDKILEIKLIKKDKILTVYDITLSELQTLSEKKLLELKEKINEIKTEIFVKNEKKITTPTKLNKTFDTNNSKENYKEKILDYYNKLINIDDTFKERYQNLINGLSDFSSQRAKLIFDEIKLIYTKRKKELIKTKIYKEELSKFKPKINKEELKKDLENILKKQIITKKEYENIFIKITKEIILNEKITDQKKLLAEKLSKSLKETHYTIIENEKEFINNIINNKRIILPIKNENYRVVVQLNKNNELLTRFIKIVDNKKNISTSEKLKDKSELKKWCNIQKKVYEKLSKDFKLNIKIVEDDEADILYIIDDKKNQNQRMKKVENGKNSLRK